MVFYLKYRPKKFSELDSIWIYEKLQRALKGKLPDPRLSSKRTRPSGSVPHAFLFTGPRGLGKTSTARIIAKSINCTNRKGSEIEPCNKCSSCTSINNGSNLDVLEIDGASNRGIDEIRDLREKIRLTPVMSYKKIYIIDEVHMLTQEAFNALLKTLEEPPNHAFFILCTTEAGKVPETITSRCFHLSFSRAGDDELVRSFQRIVKGEKLKAEKQALLEIAHLSDGSFRDGAKILEELSRFSNITVKLIEKNFKTKNINLHIRSLINSLESRDAKGAIDTVDALSKEGVDFKLFTEKLIEVLHLQLIEEVKTGSPKTSRTKDLIELLAKSHKSIKYAILPQLPLELAIVEWTSKNESRIMNHESSDIEEKSGSSLVSSKKPNIPNNPNLKRDKAAFANSSGRGGHDKILEELIGRVKKENVTVAGVLRGSRVEKFENNKLTLSTGYKFHKDRLSSEKVLSMIEKTVSEITGKKTKVSIMLKQ